jgi:hypothetical protein
MARTSKKVINPSEPEVIVVKSKVSAEVVEEIKETVVSDDYAAKRKLRRLRHLGYR